jgi:hypothetical protein
MLTSTIKSSLICVNYNWTYILSNSGSLSLYAQLFSGSQTYNLFYLTIIRQINEIIKLHTKKVTIYFNKRLIPQHLLCKRFQMGNGLSTYTCKCIQSSKYKCQLPSTTHFCTKTMRQDHTKWHDCNENRADKFILFMIYSMTLLAAHQKH